MQRSDHEYSTQRRLFDDEDKEMTYRAVPGWTKWTWCVCFFLVFPSHYLQNSSISNKSEICPKKIKCKKLIIIYSILGGGGWVIVKHDKTKPSIRNNRRRKKLNSQYYIISICYATTTIAWRSLPGRKLYVFLEGVKNVASFLFVE